MKIVLWKFLHHNIQLAIHGFLPCFSYTSSFSFWFLPYCFSARLFFLTYFSMLPSLLVPPTWGCCVSLPLCSSPSLCAPLPICIPLPICVSLPLSLCSSSSLYVLLFLSLCVPLPLSLFLSPYLCSSLSQPHTIMVSQSLSRRLAISFVTLLLIQ